MPHRALPPVPLPVHVNIETSLLCNLSCIMCAPHLTGSTQKRDLVSDALLERIEDQVLPEAAFVALTVAGEPFADKTWPRYLALAKRTGTRLVVHCNGTLLPKEDDLERLLKHTQVLEFSVDAVERDTFASIRGQDALPRILDNIRRAVAVRDRLPKRQRPRLGVTMVLMKRNIAQLPAMVDMAADLGLDSVGAVHLTVFADHLDGESLRHRPAVADAAFALARQRAAAAHVTLNLPPDMDGTLHRTSPTRARIDHARGILGKAGRRWAQRVWRVAKNRLAVSRWSQRAGGKVGCNYLMHRAYVSVGGDVTPCCMPGRPVVGNLLNQDFDTIWNGPIYTAMRRGMLDGRPFDCCAHCSVNRDEGYVPFDERTARPPDQQLMAAPTPDTTPEGRRAQP